MNKERMNQQALVKEIIEATIKNMLPGNAALRETVPGHYTYEVPPLPGHRLNDEECDAVRRAKDPTLEISLHTCWMYYDAIDATEQNLLQLCRDKVLERCPEANREDICKRFHSLIEVLPPFHYYLQQAF